MTTNEADSEVYALPKWWCEHNVQLLDVYSCAGTSVALLYRLLSQRTHDQSISHKTMPTFAEHLAFVCKEPYTAWYVILGDDYQVGAVYLSKQREIGISILDEFRHRGYGTQAVRLLMARHPGKFLANVNPANAASANLFRHLGFGLIQHTYARE